jgi:hypothetical protein
VVTNQREVCYTFVPRSGVVQLVARQPLELVILVRVQAPEPTSQSYSITQSGSHGDTCGITAEVPQDLLEKARQASGTDIAQTVRAGLQLVGASLTYARILHLRGKDRFTRSLAELKADR